MQTLIIFIFFIALSIFVRGKLRKAQRDGSKTVKILKPITYTLYGLTFLVIVFNTFTIVNDGTTKVVKLFGKVSKTTLKPGGPYLINPFYDLTTYNTQRNALNVTDGDDKPGMRCMSTDEVPLDVEVTYAYNINPDYAWWIKIYIGMNLDELQNKLILPAATSTTRDIIADFTSTESYITKRDELKQSLQTKFNHALQTAIYEQGGISEEEASLVINVLPVEVKGIMPDPKVQNSLAENKASEIDLDRQATLTAIAEEAANRMNNEGMGLKKMFENLPKDYTPSEIALVLHANADKTRAEALTKAVETGQLNSAYFEGTAARTK